MSLLRFAPAAVLAAFFRSLALSLRGRAALQLENLALRHQVGLLQRSVKRPKLTSSDRLLWVCLCRLWPDWRSALIVVQPATVIAWHRKGFRLFWTRKGRCGQRGRPSVPQDVRELIRRLNRENPLWGAPRIHGELLKLGITIGETSVGKYMRRHRRPPSQTWRTFLDNHVRTLVSVDFFTVPTIRFQVLFVFLILAHDRRRILHVGVTAHPTAEWTAQQLREAFPWETAPRYLLRDRDGIFGHTFVDQVRAMGMSEVLSTPGSPWQRAYVEHVIGTIRRECLDHVMSSVAHAVFATTSVASWTTIIRAERISDYTKTPRSHGRSRALRSAGSCRYPKWAACTIVTSAERPEGARVAKGQIAYPGLAVSRRKGKVGRPRSFKRTYGRHVDRTGPHSLLAMQAIPECTLL